jgi:hypothetical protein
MRYAREWPWPTDRRSVRGRFWHESKQPIRFATAAEGEQAGRGAEMAAFIRGEVEAASPQRAREHSAWEQEALQNLPVS